MKKFIFSLACAACALTMSAQRASDAAVSYNDVKDYNRIGISYNNDHYGFNKYLKDDDFDGISTNGIGIDYRHGFSFCEHPMFIETGASFNFNFGSKDWETAYDKETLKFKNFNLLVPVNFVYRFSLTEDFSIAPYAGINFKINMVTKEKSEYVDYDDPQYNEESDWVSMYDDAPDAM